MTANGWFQIGLYLFVIFLVTKPLGVFMTRVFNREKTFLDPTSAARRKARLSADRRG